MWMNHHNMFNYVRRVDRRFMLLNGRLLMFVTLTPFTTSLVAGHILSGDANTAAWVYSGGFFLLAIVYNVLWRYASGGGRLLGSEVTATQVRNITRQYLVGPLGYTVAFLVSFADGLASVIIILLIMFWFGVTTTLVST